MEREVVVQHPEGLHARPAAEFVRLAGRFKASVRVRLGDCEADARSMMAIMALGVDSGTKVVLVADGEDAEEALNQLTAFLTEAGR